MFNIRRNYIDFRLNVRSSLNFLLFFIVAVGASVFLLFKINDAIEEIDQLSNTPYYKSVRESFPAAEIPTNGWKTYRNEKYGFEVKFPSRWFSMKTEIIHDDYYGGDHIIFQLPTVVSSSYREVCDISIYPENNWKRFQADDTSGKPIYFNSRNGTVYGHGCGQDDDGFVGFDAYNNAVSKKEFNTPIAETPYGEFRLKILPTFKFIE